MFTPLGGKERTGGRAIRRLGIREWDQVASAGRGQRRSFRQSKLFPLTEEAIRDHLLGRQTIGVYPLLQDDTCWFVAVDFDKKSWERDACAFLKMCCEIGVPASLERSRSGDGGHVWIFFQSPVQAALARKLASAVLTRTMERRYAIGLDSYDRLFPSQDTTPPKSIQAFFNKDANLRSLGIFLHYVQDTYSHETFTDPVCGHGCLDFHYHDKTDSNVAKSVRMAQRTWAELVKFAKEKGKCGCKEWGDASWADVTKFAKASGGPDFREINGPELGNKI
jgi:hypothetical protein